ncbi:MAG: ATP phosphoribosyltransferase regulatory subunit, partial [Bryobacteraceae bacterium]
GRIALIRGVKGMRDILPPSSAVWNQVEAAARRIFARFNYQEIRTPILEETALFSRSVGEETDIVSKEMYTFEDRDGASLTLRPESTASVLRAYIEHRLDQRPGLQKLYYIGPMFRRERPQKGRYRQFYQIGAEAIGSDSPAVDAEVIELVVTILHEIGIRDFELLVNSVGSKESRARYNKTLKEELKETAPKLCEDCRRRA